jgi:hypothetical protein
VGIWRLVLNFKLEITMSDQTLEKDLERAEPVAPAEIMLESMTDKTSSTLNLEPRSTVSGIALDPGLIAELCEVTNDPSQAVNMAIRQWLQRRSLKEADTSRPMTMNPIVPPRGEWND